MGFILLIIFLAVSFFIGKMIISSKPEILDWSVNKKQSIVIAWFFFSLLVLIGIQATQPDFAIENHLISSIVTAILMGAAFYIPLKKKNTA